MKTVVKIIATKKMLFALPNMLIATLLLYIAFGA